jgi:hypothetical protein
MCNCACLKGTVQTRVKSITKPISFKKSLYSISCRAERHSVAHKIRRIYDVFNNEEANFVAI